MKPTMLLIGSFLALAASAIAAQLPPPATTGTAVDAARQRYLQIVTQAIEDAPSLDVVVGRQLYPRLRTDLLRAGAHQDDIARLTPGLVQLALDHVLTPTRDARDAQIDLIGRLFTQCNLRVSKIAGDRVVVELSACTPDAPGAAR